MESKINTGAATAVTLGAAVFGALFGNIITTYNKGFPEMVAVGEDEFLYRVEEPQDLSRFGDPNVCAPLEKPIHVEPGDILGVRATTEGCHQVWKQIATTKRK